eukprot:TRINITY_DN20395_c0_g1_i1.p2 TRINITY_DN20395_c0_g1~~TRINITY_DN20395_c0_g1_i1.p2  ORF type:complete len:147 (-),score=8.32 TRINITY_DN20395_c0_g1_i1:64-504(-)
MGQMGNEITMDLTVYRVTDQISDIHLLSESLDAKAASIHVHVPTDVTGLMSGGKISQEWIPQIAISNVYVVASQVQQNALVVQTGDVAIRTDTNENPMYSALIPVSYTHLTLPTICSVQISVVAGSLKKKTTEQAAKKHQGRRGRK